MTSIAPAQYSTTQPRLNLPFIIGASSVGTLIEWYAFYLYGVFAAFFARHFFPPGNESLALLASLAVFWFGFLLRPFGAIFFGHLGDLIGRKFTFMLTLLLMGAATFLVGLIPSYASWGYAAPILILLMRAVQGLALGGEYGGAATYIAEHAPDGKRGLYTSWIQTTATMGIVLALLAILICRQLMSDAAFTDWGWRIPFLISAILVLLSGYIRLKLAESPLYALIYMTTVLKLNYVTVYTIMMVALTIGSLGFIFFGWLSDHIGRRNIMTWGFALAVITYWPVFTWLGTFRDNPVMLTILVLYLVILVTMVYGPIAAFLVELFQARIRHSSMSMPYHTGNGWFGGGVPFIGTALAPATGIAR